jgi:hypothetical protein
MNTFKILASTILLALHVNASAQSTKYFRNITPNHFFGFDGTYPATFDQVKAKEHFQFKYDNQNRLIAIFHFMTGENLNYSEPSKSAVSANRMFYVKDTCYSFSPSNSDDYEKNETEMLKELLSSNEIDYTKTVLFKGKVNRVYNVNSNEETLFYRFSYPAKNQIVKTKMFMEDVPYVSDGYKEEHISFDPKKLITTISYYGLNNTRVATKKGVYEKIMHSNQLGQKESEFYRDQEGQIVNEGGIASSKYYRLSFDVNGMNSGYAYFNTFDKPIVNKQTVYVEDEAVEVATFSSVQFAYDVFGNNSGTTYYNEKNQKMVNLAVGFCEVRSIFSSTGSLLARRFYNVDGKMMKIAFDGEQIAGWVNTYDQNEALISDHYLDENNSPLTINGVTFKTYSKIETKNQYYTEVQSTTLFFDVKMNKVNDFSGAHKLEKTANIYENDDDGYITLVYDKDGRLLGEEFYEADDALNIRRVAKNDNKDIIEESWFDANRNKTNHANYHKIVYIFQELPFAKIYPDIRDCNLKESQCFDKDGNPATYLGTHKVTNEIEKFEDRYYITTKQFDVNNQLVSDSTHAAISIRVLSDEPSEYEAAFEFDKNNQPFINPDNNGVWKVEQTYLNGVKTLTQYGPYDVKTTSTKDLPYYILYQSVETVNKKKSLRTIAYFGESKKPSTTSYGNYHKCETVIDPKTEAEKSVAYFDVANKPTINSELGYHKVLKIFTKDGNVKEEMYYDAKNNSARISLYIDDKITNNNLGIENIFKVVNEYQVQEGVEKCVARKYYSKEGQLLAEDTGQ